MLKTEKMNGQVPTQALRIDRSEYRPLWRNGKVLFPTKGETFFLPCFFQNIP